MAATPFLDPRTDSRGLVGFSSSKGVKVRLSGSSSSSSSIEGRGGSGLPMINTLSIVADMTVPLESLLLIGRTGPLETEERGMISSSRSR